MKKPVMIARDSECAKLQGCMESDRSEFVIVCGRRRVGKTFLVDQFFKGNFDFAFTGGHKVPTKVQLRNFAKALKFHAQLTKAPVFSDWYDAFDALEEWLAALPTDRKKVLFFDEMPWIDTLRSDFVSALENFWNGWANRRYDIVLVASGSATSWMADKLIENQGGLHNRITARLYLQPFTLKETEEYLRSRKCGWNRYQIMQCYMLTGGVPFYLSQMNPKLSVAQNIDLLCFRENGEMRREFDELYNALFNNVEGYIAVVRLLFHNRKGLMRSEIAKSLNCNGTFLNKILKNLEQCNFITHRIKYGSKNESIYRLVDFYTIFYLKFLEYEGSLNEDWWINHIESSKTLSWMGYAFEMICLTHHRQIKRALSIAGIPTEISTWRQIGPNLDADNVGAQIDMLIERSDQTIHLCEMKFCSKEYAITKEEYQKLHHRRELFRQVTGTKKALLYTFVTTYGLSNPEAWDIVHSEVTMDDLFNS